MPERRRYTIGAMALHWLIAAFILANLLVGWRMIFLKGMAQFELFQLHKSIGITVLLLSIARLAWRLVSPPPPLPEAMRPWERGVAHAVHWAFYGIMIFMPLTGWVLVSVSPYNLPTLLWRVIPWPHLFWLHDLPMDGRKAVEAATGRVHLSLAIGSVLLIALHLAAALKHQIVDRDGLLGRMVPGLGARST
ncbi:MAG: cytochrome b [Phenylobacterium sp.]|nr:cytochrome b [Phenylobacterium sp.]